MLSHVEVEALRPPKMFIETEIHTLIPPHKALNKLLFRSKGSGFYTFVIFLQNVINRIAILQQNIFSFDTLDSFLRVHFEVFSSLVR